MLIYHEINKIKKLFFSFILLSSFGLYAQEMDIQTQRKRLDPDLTIFANHVIPFPLGTVITYQKDVMGELYTARLGVTSIHASTCERGIGIMSTNIVKAEKQPESKVLANYYHFIWAQKNREQRLDAMRILYALQETQKENHWQQLAQESANKPEVSC